MKIYTDKFDFDKWKLKHKLIVRQIKEKGDFDLKEINKELENGKQKDVKKNCGRNK